MDAIMARKIREKFRELHSWLKEPESDNRLCEMNFVLGCLKGYLEALKDTGALRNESYWLLVERAERLFLS